MVSAAVLSIVLPSVLLAVIFYCKANRVRRETAVAREALREQVERLKGAPFEDVFALYNADAADDSAGLGPAPGPAFTVAGLRPAPGDADGIVGAVEIPSFVPAGGVAQLREDVLDPSFGLPRDLDADGALDALDHALDYALLPARVRVRWAGVSGPRELRATLLLSYR